MQKMRIFLVLLIGVSLIFCTGCRGQSGRRALQNIKGFFVHEAKEEAIQRGIEYGVGAVTGNDSNNRRATSPTGGGKSTVAKMGAVAAGGVAAVSSVLPDTDLALGDICIGLNKNDVYERMGRENSVTNQNDSGHLRYQYRDMEVVITNGTVTAFVSNTQSVSTPRGVSQGDSVDKVTLLYGSPDLKSNYDGATLYEYKRRSIDGKNCLLRFSIKNGVVDYISARVLDDDKPAQNSAPNDDANNAARVLVNYYENIATKNMRQAYDSLTWNMQNRLGTYENFSTDYDTTISNTVDNLSIDSQAQNKIILNYRLTSKDNINGRLVTQVFIGKATMTFENGRWLISDLKVKTA